MLVGLTGGIGSGKSTVLERFKTFEDVAVYNADLEAKRLMNTSAVIKEKLLVLFGEKAYINNHLNRNYIASIVFSDAASLKQLNAIVHPEVHQHLKSFVQKNQHKAYVLYENAILFENKSDIFCDVIITVVVDEATRVERVVARDNTTPEAIRSRIQNQWLDAKKVLLSHYIVCNYDRNMLDDQIIEIHNNLTKLKR